MKPSIIIMLKRCSSNTYGLDIFLDTITYIDDEEYTLIKLANEIPPVPFKTACRIGFELQTAYFKSSTYCNASFFEPKELRERVNMEYEIWRKQNETHNQPSYLHGNA